VAWIYLLAGGVMTSVFYLLLFRALEQGEQSRVIPLERLSLVLAMVLGAIFFKEKLAWAVIGGGALMRWGLADWHRRKHE